MNDGSTDAFDNIRNGEHSIGRHFPVETIGPECDGRVGYRLLLDRGEVGGIAAVDGVMQGCRDRWGQSEVHLRNPGGEDILVEVGPLETSQCSEIGSG